MLTFLAGMACGVLLMMIALGYIMSSTDSEPQPETRSLCWHNRDWDDCPDCRH